MGRGGSLEVSVLAFYSNDLSSIPAGYLICSKKTKINEKNRPGLAHLLKVLGDEIFTFSVVTYLLRATLAQKIQKVIDECHGALFLDLEKLIARYFVMINHLLIQNLIG